MNLKLADLKIVVIALAVLLSGLFIYSHYSDPLPSCLAGENEICPSAAWVHTYRRVNEMGASLRSGIPGGYRFDEQSGKFVKMLPPLPPPPPARPPAPTEPKK